MSFIPISHSLESSGQTVDGHEVKRDGRDGEKRRGGETKRCLFPLSSLSLLFVGLVARIGIPSNATKENKGRDG